MDPGQFDRVFGRESLAPGNGLVRDTGRSPAVQVPEDPFGCLLAGDRPVLLPHPEDGSLGEWGGERRGGTINTVLGWTFFYCKYLYIGGEHYGRVDKSKSLL